MDLKQHIGMRLRAARTRRGLTQEEVAEQLGKAVETISNIERGHTLTGLETLDRLCRRLEIPMSEVLEGYDGERQVPKVRLELEHRLGELARSLPDDDLRMAVDLVTVLDRHRRGE